jgi:hypothetical protein
VSDTPLAREYTSGWTKKAVEFGRIGSDGKPRGYFPYHIEGMPEYGVDGGSGAEESVPSFIAYDRLVMSFYAYFKGFHPFSHASFFFSTPFVSDVFLRACTRIARRSVPRSSSAD